MSCLFPLTPVQTSRIPVESPPHEGHAPTATESLDEAAHALTCKARYSLSIGAKRLIVAAPTGPRECKMSSHLHREMSDLLAAVPAGELLLVSGYGSPRCIDAQLAAVVAAGFELRGVSWHHEHTIGGRTTKVAVERVVRAVFVRPAVAGK